MTDARPLGFIDYIRANGFHTVYLLTPVQGWPVKVGISDNPVQRISTIQVSNYQELVYHRFWWLPGVEVATRIESDFKRELFHHNIRGEWFNVSTREAQLYVEAAIERLGIWSLTQSEMEHAMDQWLRKRWKISPEAPSPLPGRPPRTDEPWDRRPRAG